MLRITLKSVRGHLARFLLTAFAVMIGVAFVAGTFVLRDSINSTLSGLFDQAGKGVDVVVRGADAGTENQGASSRAALPLTLQQTLAAVPGVKRAVPDLQGSILIAGKDGTAVRSGGAPGLGFAYDPAGQAFVLTKGDPSRNAGEVLVEKRTLELSKLAIGDTTKAVVGDQVRDVKITGEVAFGSGTLFGATAVLLDEASARAAFAADGRVPTFSLQADGGVSQEALRAAVAKVLPGGTEAVTATKVNEENQSGLKTALGFITTFLLVFAGISLFVGSFIIYNTFAMLVAQRTRELALLRAVGASRRQVRGVVLGEAVVIGVLGSAAGIGLGVLIAAGAKAALRTFVGVDLTAALPVGAMTVLWSLLVGIVVTIISAIFPARRASRVAPVAAMRDDLVIAPKGLRLRGTIGLLGLAAGAGLLAWAVTRSDVAWILAGVGAGACVLAALVAAPVTTRPVVRVVALPFAAFAGVVGRLARENALRVPRRTATTASALMIGLALIAAISVVAQSTKASVSDLISRELRADYVLSGGGAVQVPESVAPAVASLPGVQSVAPVSFVGLRVGDTDLFAVATSGTAFGDNVAVTMRAGSLAALDRGELLVDATTAAKNHWSVGSRVTAAVGGLSDRPLVVGGVFEDLQLLQGATLVLPEAVYQEAVPAAQRFMQNVYVKAAPGSDVAALRSALAGLVKPYLVVSVEDGKEYQDSQAGQIDFVLNMLYVLLLFSVVIAVLGIINTLALSVFERTREIGLLRAVGLRRGQLAGMITIEAVTTALFGAVLGTALGLGLGIALQRGLRSQGLDTLAIPWSTVAVVLVASAIVGVLAAILPAVRASRLDILRAIATE
jgi:putative ABC transport system permease protein